MSFALIAIVHFARAKLNLALALSVAILVLYVAFSGRLYALVDYDVAIMLAFIQDLSALELAGEFQSLGTTEFLYSWERLNRYDWVAAIAIYGMFFGVILYFSYSVLRARHRRAA